jgi:hypothetical protein
MCIVPALRKLHYTFRTDKANNLSSNTTDVMQHMGRLISSKLTTCHVVILNLNESVDARANTRNCPNRLIELIEVLNRIVGRTIWRNY